MLIAWMIQSPFTAIPCMRPRRYLVQARRWNLLFAMITLCSLAAGQEQAKTDADRLNHDPDAAVISASDVRLFWNAYDLWQKREHGEPGKLAGILQSEYLDKA